MVQVRVGTGRGAPQKARTFDTRRQAQQWADEMRVSVRRGEFIDPADARVTFKTYAEDWRTTRRGIRQGTADSYESHLRVHVYPHLGRLPLSQIRRHHLEAMVDSMEGLAPSTVRGVLLTARIVLRAAVKDGLVRTSPADGVQTPEVVRTITTLTPEQAAGLLAVASGEARPTIALGLGAGLRQGEVLGLHVGNVDFLRKTVSVTEQAIQGKVGPPKTRASRRVVPVPEWVVNELARWVEQHPTDGPLFTRNEALWHRSAFNRRVWKPAVEKAGLPATLGFHSLRHTYASTLIAAGLHIKVIQTRLGHASIVETSDVYGHLFPHADDETRAALDSAYTVGDKLGTSVKGAHPL